MTNWRGVSELSTAEVSALNENYEVLCASPFAVVLKPKNRSVNVSSDYFTPLFRWKCGAPEGSSPPHLMVAENVR